MSVRRFSVLALTSCLLFPLTRSAGASQSFPDTVKDDWELPSVPACTLCHQALIGGFGTATKPFGRALMKKGATAANTSALQRALAALQASDSDVDGDGVTDYDELQTGTDPNIFDAMAGEGGTSSVPPDDDKPIPRTGCSVASVGAHTWLTARQPSPTVGPISGANAPSRRISGDAWLVCGLILGAVTVRLRSQRKRMASAAR